MEKNIKTSFIVALIAYIIVIISNFSENGFKVFLQTWWIMYSLIVYIATLLTLNAKAQQKQ